MKCLYLTVMFFLGLNCSGQAYPEKYLLKDQVKDLELLNEKVQLGSGVELIEYGLDFTSKKTAFRSIKRNVDDLKLVNSGISHTEENRSSWKNFVANVSINHPVAKVEAFYKQINDKTQNTNEITFTISVITRKENIILDSLDKINYQEGTTDINIFNNFKNEYGTHFISQINYGYTILVKITTSNQKTMSKSDFKGKISAFLGKASGDITLNTEEKQEISNYSTSLITKLGVDTTIPLYIANVGELKSMLDSLNSKQRQINSIPISVNLTSYKSYINRKTSGVLVSMFESSKFSLSGLWNGNNNGRKQKAYITETDLGNDSSDIDVTFVEYEVMPPEKISATGKFNFKVSNKEDQFIISDISVNVNHPHRDCSFIGKIDMNSLNRFGYFDYKSYVPNYVIPRCVNLSDIKLQNDGVAYNIGRLRLEY